jgi:lipid-binding SYLF domain-containing protein
MRKTLGFLAMTTCLFAAPSEKERQTDADRLKASTAVMSEIMNAGDKGIPRDLLERAQCAVVVPGLKKGAFVFGGEYGKGFMTCRNPGGWSAPAAITVVGGSFGFQIGGSETDVVMLVMSPKGADRLMGDQFTLGAEGEIAAGPIGRTVNADTDAKLTAEILSWSRSRGVFAGVALKGATLKADRLENEHLYGTDMNTREVVRGNVNPTPAGRELTAFLSSYPDKARDTDRR